MKVILLKDVAKIGRKFDTVNVPDGFALNKLIPKNMAQQATPENLKRLQNLSAKLSEEKEREAESFKAVVDALKDIEVTIEVEANNEGRMFQALKPEAISEAIRGATGHAVGVEHIVMKVPIKTVGEHLIDITSGEAHGGCRLHVTAKGK